MGAISPQNLRVYPFGGQVTTSTQFIGPLDSPFLAGKTITEIPGMSRNALVVSWEIRNNESSGGNNLLVRFGPKTGLFTASAGNVLDNYFTLPPGVAYSFHAWPQEEQINDNVGGSDYSILLVQASATTANYTGICTVYDPADA
tara:strand:- start:60 stop:491 length:432 start_codon:yes stop_codon:yes gene_type:complete